MNMCKAYGYRLKSQDLEKIMLIFGNTMVNVTNPSWHISYPMKLWLNYANKGFDGGLVQIHKCWGLNYMNVGKNHIEGGTQGGPFMAPRGMGKTSPKIWSGHCWDSFESTIGCMYGLALDV